MSTAITSTSGLVEDATLEERSGVIQQGEEEEQQQQKQQQRQQEEGERSLIMSLHDVVVHIPPPPSSTSPQQQEQLPSNHLLDDISSPISAQIFDFCDPDMFSDTLQNSEATSSPNCYCYDDQNSSYATNISFPSNLVDNENNNNNSDNSNIKFSTQPLDISNFQLGDQSDQNNLNNISTTSSTTTTPTTSIPNHHHHISHQGSNLSIIFDSADEIDNDISASIDFSPSPPFSAPLHPPTYNNGQLRGSVLGSTTTQQWADIASRYTSTTSTLDPTILPGLIGPPLPPLGTVFEDDCGLSTIPPFLRLNHTSAGGAASSSSSCSFLDPSMSSFLPGSLNQGLGGDNPGIFSGTTTTSLLMGSDLQAKDMDFQGDNSGIFCPDQLPRVYNSGDMQAFSNESSQLVSGATSSAPLATEISSLEDSTFKVGKLSAEQRKEKIHRYMKKRNERNFSKKIKYACRKTLADSRPRVRGRFAKNDDFGETHRHMNGHEDDDYDEVAVKEEDDMVDSSDIFSHISGVNSFKCNYQIQSWI